MARYVELRQQIEELKIKQLYQEGLNPPDVTGIHFIQVYYDALTNLPSSHEPIKMDVIHDTSAVGGEDNHLSCRQRCYLPIVQIKNFHDITPVGVMRPNSIYY